MKRDSTISAAKDPAAATAYGRQRGPGSRPSGNSQATAVTAANSSGQPRSPKSTAHAPPGSAPGSASTA